ncbi:hypothetical protein [Mesobacillus zeae]|uniref:hypothetical protein n=1 Tax=Mesobacillus zeae TaxID=1917180 RepID=UPI003008F2BC
MMTKKKPYEKLTTIGCFYEVSTLNETPLQGIKTTVISGEFKGWFYDEPHDYLYAIIMERGASSANDYYVGDIVDVVEIGGHPNASTISNRF